MNSQNDALLQSYIDESLEHLSDIENDILALEDKGTKINKELVDKVFRAAHSIKGGAGFLGLTNIKELSHKMENVLGMIRNQQIVPNAKIINILLSASDALKDLINNVSISDEIDISKHIKVLNSVDETLLHTADNKLDHDTTSNMIDISFPDGISIFTVSKNDIINAWDEGQYIYLFEIDKAYNESIKDKTPQNILEELQNSGSILATNLDKNTACTFEDYKLEDNHPFAVLFACVLEPGNVDALVEIDKKYIFKLTKDLNIQPIDHPDVIEHSDSEKPESKLSAITTAKEPVLKEPVLKEPQLNDKKQIDLHNTDDKRTNDKRTKKKRRTTSQIQDTQTSLRIHVKLLDSLMTLAGEMVLSRNQLLQAISSGSYSNLEDIGQRIDIITSGLQEAIMRTRMQPIANVFNKFSRLVRDFAKNLQKEIELTIQGKDVELDKTIIEAIGDPLTHLIRNSVDHGIEMPSVRHAAGKNTVGKIILKAYHEAGHINIEISDDGKGLDGEKLAAKAVSKGLLTEERAKIMSKKEKMYLIFMPGFSMAEKITDVSGRGVGMDVVKTNLDKLGGLIDIDSLPGKGTTIRIKLPLTLAIITSQIILDQGNRYAIPQVNLEELLRISANQVKHKIEIVGQAEVLRLRGILLPLIRLSDVIGSKRTYYNNEDKNLKKDKRQNIADRRSKKNQLLVEFVDNSSEDEYVKNESELMKRDSQDRRYHTESAFNVAVISTGSMKYGLIIDKLYDSEEIVVKPLGRHLKCCKGYLGAAIMGDGRVALILDVIEIAKMAELFSIESSDKALDTTIKDNKRIKTEKKRSLLVFRNAEEERFAVPLNQVVRIEKIKNTDIEKVGNKKVIQYRDRNLVVFRIDEIADVKPVALKKDLLVIIFILANREVGLLAIGPVEVKDVKTSIKTDKTSLKQPGISGSIIIDKNTTLLIDMFELVHTLSPEWFYEQKPVLISDKKEKTVLVVEDSNFFRNQVKGFIENEGYNVIEAEDGAAAWSLLLEHVNKISLIVTDIEMPNLDGWGLTEKIREDDRYSHLPVIALTTMAEDKDIKKAKEIGINDYLIKLDKEKLIETIRVYLVDDHKEETCSKT